MVEWRALLDWEEGVFRALLRGWQWASPGAAPGAPARGGASFDAEARSLTVLARTLTAEPVRLRSARGAGGVRGADLLLPASMTLAAELGANREAYRVQVVVASGIRLLSRAREAPAPHTFESALESLRIAQAAVTLMCDELPEFRGVYERVMSRVISARSLVDVARLSRREAELECARRAALAGEEVWKDRDLCNRLVGARQGRRLSPELAIWGSWLPAVEDARPGSPTPGPEERSERMTELDAPDVDVLRRVDLDSREDGEQSVPVAPFERAESLDSYRGGKRDLDGTDELEAHLDALEQVDLGELFRGPGASQSLLKANLELGVDVSDAAARDRSKGISYDEWDVRKRVYRRKWCTVFPARAGEGAAGWAEERLHQHRALVRVLRRRLEEQRSGLRAAPRQLDGEDIDLDAAIDDSVAQLAGRGSNPRVYQRQHRRRRDFATTLLLDVSMSTDSWVDGRRVLDVAREAALVLGEVAHELGDRLQVLGFASETRNRCLVWEALAFGEDWSGGKRRIAWLEPRGYTRIGPALRHATAMLANEVAERRLLLLISDGKPTDYDRYEGRYGIGDVRMALREAERRDIHAHALAVDSCARDYLPALFGEGGWHVLPRPDALVEALTEVYGRLTAR